MSGLKGSLYRCVLQLVFLPYKVALLLEAILVTIYRMLISKKHLLEWLTAADAEKVLGKDLKSFLREMIISPLIGFALIETSIICKSIPAEATLSLFLIWFMMPYISFFIGQSDVQKREEVQEEAPKL